MFIYFGRVGMDISLHGLYCKLKVIGLVSDSFMMGIVNSAMEEAYARACSREGEVIRLNEKSRFCELAIIQLDWCVKFIQEDMDNGVVDSNFEIEKLFLDLVETRNQIRRRLEETELAIEEKDRELRERKENELKFRQVIESKDEELNSFHASLGIEKINNERSHGNAIVTTLNEDRNVDNDLYELKSAVDKGFGKVTKTYENERQTHCSQGRERMDDNTMVSGNTKLSKVCKEGPEFSNKMSNKVFAQMGSEGGILKDTLKVVLEMMDNAVSHSNLSLMEQQLKFDIEKEMISLVFQNFSRDIQESLEKSLSNKKNQNPLLDNYLSILMNDIKNLRHELSNVLVQGELLSKSSWVSQSCGSCPDSSSTVEFRDNKVYLKSSINKFSLDHNNNNTVVTQRYKECSLISEEKNYQKLLDLPSCNEELRFQNPLYKQDLTDHTTNFVAKMIQNHEIIIKQKTQEINFLKQEIQREKGCSSLRKDNDLTILKKIIPSIISRLDNIIYENIKLSQKTDYSSYEILDNEGIIPVLCPNKTNLMEELNHSKQEKEDLDIQITMLEMIHEIIFKETFEDVKLEMVDYVADSCMREDIHKIFLNDMIWKYRGVCDSYKLDSFVREEVFQTCSRNSIIKPHFSLTQNSELDPFLENKYGNSESIVSENFIQEMDSIISVENRDYDFETCIGEDIFILCVKSMILGCEEEVECIDLDNSIMKDIFQTVLSEWVKDVTFQVSLSPVKCETIEGLTSLMEGFSYPMVLNEGCSQRAIETHPFLSTIEQPISNVLDLVVTYVMYFSKEISTIECLVQEKIDSHNQRLEELYQRLYFFSENLSSVRTKESLYRKAFTRRCYDLQKAETEVDLLADEVDMLIGILEKTYIVLDHYYPVFQHYFGIMDILKLMRKVLIGEASIPHS